MSPLPFGLDDQSLLEPRSVVGCPTRGSLLESYILCPTNPMSCAVLSNHSQLLPNKHFECKLAWIVTNANLCGCAGEDELDRAKASKRIVTPRRLFSESGNRTSVQVPFEHTETTQKTDRSLVRVTLHSLDK